MRTYLAYTRVSTARQGEGVSLEEQKEAIRRFASRNGMTISEWFEEQETAAKRGRPVFTSMMKILRARKADGVIMHKIDRSARNLRDWADLAELVDDGIEIHFANESFDLNSRGGRLSADIQAVVAADYIRNLREEIKKGMYGQLRLGLYPWPAPLGYLDQGGGNPKSIDPIRGPLIKEAFTLYATGQWSVRRLNRKLYQKGLRTKSGRELSHPRLHSILHASFYTGIIQIKKTGDTYPGIHEPLVSKHLFDEVQRQFDRRNRPRVQKHFFTFSRLIACELCGRFLVGEKQKGRVYYRCHDRDCHMTSIREDRFEHELVKLLTTLQFSDEEWFYLQHEVQRLAQERRGEKVSSRENFRLKLAKLEGQLRRLTDGYLDEVIEKELYLKHKEQLLGEAATLKEKLEGPQDDPLLEKVEEYLELAKSPCLSYFEGSCAKKREMVEEMTSNRTASPSGGSLELLSPYSIIANRTSVKSGGAYRNVGRTFGNEPRTKPRRHMRRLLHVLISSFEGDL